MPIPLLWPLAGVAVMSLALAARAESYTVRVMAQESIPPKWLMRGEQPEGVCPDILRAIEKVEPRVKFAGMADYRSVPVIEQGLEAGTVHGACALLDTERRRKIATVAGKALYTVRHRLAAAAGDRAAIDSYEDLVRLKPLITTSRGAAYSEQLRVLGLDVDDSSGDNVTNLRKLIAGHGRFYYMNELTLGWMVREHQLQDKVRVLPGVFREEPIYFWLSKKMDPGAARLVHLALLRLKNSGELGRIYERWSAARPSP